MNLEGKIVLRPAPAGANVLINYRSHPEGAEETLAKVEAIGCNCYIDNCSLWNYQE